MTWLKHNQMIANPEKFHVIFLRRDQMNASEETVNIKGEPFKSEETLKLPGIYRDYELTFEEHISEICRRVKSQQDSNNLLLLTKSRSLSRALPFQNLTIAL